MAAYLFELRLRSFTEELIALIPEHRAHVNNLFEAGVLTSYAVTANRDAIWCVLQADSQAEAQEQIRAMPLFVAVQSQRCTLLMFHQAASPALPGISLN